MNNLYLTFLCNNRCPYCFLTGKLKYQMGQCREEDFLTIDDALYAAEFFSSEISFLGGEPTLHPSFSEITDIFLERGYDIFLFTNGRFSDRVLEYLLSVDSVFPVFNVNEPTFYSSDSLKVIHRNLEALAGRINSLSVNISSIGQDTGYIVDLAAKYLVKAVKIGLAAPSSGGGECVPFKDRHLLAEPLVTLVEKLGAAGVITYGECEKLKPCMLNGSLKERLLAAGWRGAVYVNRQCRNGGNIDIAPDLSVWRCLSFPESLGRKLRDFGSPEELRHFSRSAWDHLMWTDYPSEECAVCEYAHRRECDGGCMVRKINGG
jgi:radical SAM protein with 4Fe4S-binding SPASM domain